MSLVIGQAGYQLYNQLPREARAQVRDFVSSLPGRAYEHRHDIIEYIKRLRGEPMKRKHVCANDGPPSKEARGDVEEIKSTLTDFDARAQVVDAIQDKVEDRLTVLEQKVEQIQDHLHLVVDTVNVILKKINKDLRCYKEMPTSDEEFEFDDKIDE